MQIFKNNKTKANSRTQSKASVSTWISTLFVGLALAAGSVQAGEADEVSKLIQKNAYDQALARAEAYLATRPADPQMRFLKGLILTEKNKLNEAVVVFTKLTEDYPELPEPYNNLAVLYAGQGEYEKARESLEMAIRTHPSYATAYENLGDVYAKLASQSYDKALQLDGRNSSAKTKLSLVRNMITSDGSAAAPVAVAAKAPTSAAVNVALASEAPPPAPAPAPAPISKPAPVVEAPVMAAVVRTPAISEVQNPAANSAEPPVQTVGADREVLASVENWADAWSNQNMAEYLNSYSQEFDPPRGMSRSEWETQRERRIVGKATIRVVVDNPLITITGDTAVVKFKQSYFSDRLNNIANKTLELKNEGGKWRIVSERVN